MALLFVFIIPVVPQTYGYTKSRAIRYKFWLEASARQKLSTTIPNAVCSAEKSVSNLYERFIVKIDGFHHILRKGIMPTSCNEPESG